MPKHGHMRHGSLQFWPRKRAKKILPRVSWHAISDKRPDIGLLGFIGYKVGMKSAYVRDNLGTSLTKNQRITIPVTIIEFPYMRVLSVRFYKNNKVIGEVLSSNFDKEIKKKFKIPKESKKKIDDFKDKDYDDIRIVVYSQVKKTGIKKKPDVAEIGLSGKLDEKFNFVKENINKELSVKDFLNESVLKEDHGLVDVRGVTKGKGLQGPTKRFGLSLKFHKSEKGVRGPGSGGAWHPARVEFMHPMAGQMGYFTRVVYNNKVLLVDSIDGKDINSEEGFKKFGKIKNDYAIICGSIQGPSKRQLLITLPLRPTKTQSKKNYEFLELR
jgi:large subunit ribosomal protein L3